MLLAGFAISALGKNIRQVLSHQDFLVPMLINTLLSKECHEQAASDCLSILASLCSHNPDHFQKLVQERRFNPRLLEFLELSLVLRLSANGDCLAKLQKQALALLGTFCRHPLVGLKTREKLMANIQLIVQKVNILSLKVTLSAIDLLIVLVEDLDVFSDILKMRNLHREIVSVAIIAFNNLQGGRLEMDGVQMEVLLLSSLLLICQLSVDPGVGDRVISELVDWTDSQFLPLAILYHPRETQELALSRTVALCILCYAAVSPFIQISLSWKDMELLQELTHYHNYERFASTIIALHL